jgi:hypothetical protein
MKLPGFATKFGTYSAGHEGWNHLYNFGWFFVCAVSSAIYFALSHVGDYAKAERSMPFEALVMAQGEILAGVPGPQNTSEEFKADEKV